MLRKTAILFALAFAALPLITSSAGAWGWRQHCAHRLFPCIGCRLHHGYPVTTCWRPYNAFSTPPGGCAPRHGHCGHGGGNAFGGGCGPMGCGPMGCAAGPMAMGPMAMASPVMMNPMQTTQFFDPSLLPYMNQEVLVDANSGQPVQQDIQPASYLPAYGMQPYAMPYAAPYAMPYAYPSPYAMPNAYQPYPSYWYGN